MKFRMIMRYFIITALILFLLPQASFSRESGTQYKKSFLWEVQSSTAAVYILGSIHLMKQEMYPLDPVIEAAFNDAAYLVVEVNPLTVDPKKVQNEIMINGMYPGMRQLKMLLAMKCFPCSKRILKR